MNASTQPLSSGYAYKLDRGAWWCAPDDKWSTEVIDGAQDSDVPLGTRTIDGSRVCVWKRGSYVYAQVYFGE